MPRILVTSRHVREYRQIVEAPTRTEAAIAAEARIREQVDVPSSDYILAHAFTELIPVEDVNPDDYAGPDEGFQRA